MEFAQEGMRYVPLPQPFQLWKMEQLPSRPGDFQGYFVKESTKQKLHLRWFVLKGSFLYYMHSPEDEIIGIIPLEGATVSLGEIYDSPENADDSTIGIRKAGAEIVIEHPIRRRFVLLADTPKERDTYVAALQSRTTPQFRERWTEALRECSQLLQATQTLTPSSTSDLEESFTYDQSEWEKGSNGSTGPVLFPAGANVEAIERSFLEIDHNASFNFETSTNLSISGMNLLGSSEADRKNKVAEMGTDVETIGENASPNVDAADTNQNSLLGVITDEDEEESSAHIPYPTLEEEPEDSEQSFMLDVDSKEDEHAPEAYSPIFELRYIIAAALAVIVIILLFTCACLQSPSIQQNDGVALVEVLKEPSIEPRAMEPISVPVLHGTSFKSSALEEVSGVSVGAIEMTRQASPTRSESASVNESLAQGKRANAVHAKRDRKSTGKIVPKSATKEPVQQGSRRSWGVPTKHVPTKAVPRRQCYMLVCIDSSSISSV